MSCYAGQELAGLGEYEEQVIVLGRMRAAQRRASLRGFGDAHGIYYPIERWAEPPSSAEAIAQAEKDMQAGAVPVTQMQGGWPAAVPLRLDNWDLDAGLYRVASGDTASGLAYTYLGLPNRWKWIWDVRKPDWTDPNKLAVDQVLQMPDDAIAFAKAFAKKKGMVTPKQAKQRRTAAWVVGGVVGSILAGVAGYAAGGGYR
ncbi:MAG: hypothetical protein Q8Q14_05285 [Gemmatimonadales bacterium]|nr:hypothetical protein [Gemmatimonadales bacterium]